MNYAINPSPRFNQNPWFNYVNGLSTAQVEDFNQNPQYAYEVWLKNLGLSAIDERSLRQMFGHFNNLWESDPARIGQGNEANNHWVNYLRGIDLNRELARLTPSARGEQPERFGVGRTRWVTL